MTARARQVLRDRRKQNLSLLDGLAARYGKFPHELAALSMENLSFDFACYRAGIRHSKEDDEGGDG